MAVDESKKDYLANLYNQEILLEQLHDIWLKITVNCTDEYNNHSFTATNPVTHDVTSATVKNNRAVLYVNEGGTYTLTNDYNGKELTVEVEDLFNTTVNITDFTASIKVTVPDELVGETITCSLDKFNLEKVAETKTVTFQVNAQGTWKIGVKGIDAITKKDVSVTDDGGSYSTTLSLPVDTIPILRVRSKEEDNGKIVKVTKDETTLSRILKNREAWFVLPETGTWTVTCDDYPEIQKKVNATENTTYRVALRAQIFGVKVSQLESDPAGRVSYTDDAIGMSPVTVSLGDGTVNYGEWRDTWFFDKIRPCMLKTNGTVDYYLDPNDQTQKAEGGISDINTTSYEGNAMVEFEKFYIEMKTEGNYATIRVSDEEEEGFVPMGFKRNDGTEMDKAYLAMFGGWMDSQNRLRSIGNQNIRCNTSFTDFQNAAQRNGINYHLYTNGLVNMVDALYLIMFKNFDSQTAAGRGRDYNNGSGSVSGTNMTIKTGILSNKGPIAYDRSSQGVKFLWLEDYWGNNLYWWLDGWLYDKNANMLMKFGGPYNDTGAGYQTVSNAVKGVSGNITQSNWSNEYGKIPTVAGGSDSTYECDSSYTPSGTLNSVYACNRASGGVWYRNTTTVSYANTDRGAALSYEPPQGA